MTSAPTHPPIGNRQSAVGNLKAIAADIKLSHTLFALPWALLSTFLAARQSHHPITPTIILLILGCMVTARTVAMSANRLLDANLDAQNPRTARRAIPAGKVSRRFYTITLILCAIAFLILASGFWFLVSPGNPWPPILALPVLAFISAYPFLKRFTRLCHYYLGAALALAPVCAWLAIAGTLAAPPIIMAVAVLLWTAGFDIIYACQDYESDLQTGTHSVPAKLGIPKALMLSRLTHFLSALAIIAIGLSTPHLHTLYFIGAAIAVALLIIEHSLVKPTDLSKVGLAFFTINGIISLLIGTLGIIDVLRG